MQVNSVNNQNSFGLKLSPRAKDFINSYNKDMSTYFREFYPNFDLKQQAKLLQEIKKFFPGAIMDMGKGRGRIPLFGLRGWWSEMVESWGLEIPEKIKRRICQVDALVLKRKSLPDATLVTNPFWRKDLLKDVLKALKKIQKQQ